MRIENGMVGFLLILLVGMGAFFFALDYLVSAAGM